MIILFSAIILFVFSLSFPWDLFLCLILQVNKVEETSERLLAALKAEKEDLESSLSKEKLQTLQLKQDLTDAEARNTDLYKVTTPSVW